MRTRACVSRSVGRSVGGKQATTATGADDSINFQDGSRMTALVRKRERVPKFNPLYLQTIALEG